MLTTLGHPDLIAHMARSPEHFFDLTEDSVRCIHGPQDVEVRVLGQHGGVDQADMGFAAALETAKELVPVDEVVAAADPERQGRYTGVIPGRAALGTASVWTVVVAMMSV